MKRLPWWGHLAQVLRASVFVAVCAAGSSGQAVTINVRYPSATLFAPAYDATAKAAINAAAADLSVAITSSLTAITTGTYTGSSGPSQVSLHWDYYNVNPQTGAEVQAPVTVARDVVTIDVGTRVLPSGALGIGGQASAGFFPTGTAGTHQQTNEAVGNAAAASQTALRRSGGPRVTTFFSAVDGHTFSVDFGVAYGHVAFNLDTSRNGLPNTATQLSNFWHWNHTTPVAAGKIDLYSVALHEMMHVLGIGTSASWSARVSDNNHWTGPEVTAITGSGAKLISSDRYHVIDGLQSLRISDGMPQAMVMDHSLTTGQRKSLTVLDLAFLRDIGWETITPQLPSSPADFNDDGLVNGIDLGIWESSFAVNSDGDANGDGRTDGHDFLLWQRDYMRSAAVTTIPEPRGVVMIVAASVIGAFYAASSGRMRVAFSTHFSMRVVGGTSFGPRSCLPSFVRQNL